MKRKANNSEWLWNYFFGMMVALVFAVVAAMGYLILEDRLFLDSQNQLLTKEQLAKIARKREINRQRERENDWSLVENGIHVQTGLKADKDLQIIIGACTSCHSPKLISQNRATREGWKQMIDWMQATQGLADLGKDERIILNYLARHYSPVEVGRRKSLDMAEIDWYILEEAKAD